MKARFCPHGGVANPRHGEAMAVAIRTNEALPRKQIHRFHLSRYFRVTVLDFCIDKKYFKIFEKAVEIAFARSATYHEQLAKAGVLLDGSGLQASSKGWRIQYNGDKRAMTDGPFTETKELIAGYTIIQVRSRDEAQEWTRRFPNPSLDHGRAEIEVRQMFEPEDFD